MCTAPAARNLTLELAAWLRKMGFTVLELGGTEPTALEASWRCLNGMLYEAKYTYLPTGGIFQLLANPGLPTTGQHTWGLVHKAEVNRIREARFLLNSNVFYAEARRVALKAGALLPTHAQAATS